MGFWQNLADSYEKNADALKKSYPLSATSISNNSDIIVVIVIDGDGNFLRAETIPKKPKSDSPVNITIPTSEESLKRTGSNILPHPIFDQYCYLRGIPGRTDEYIEKLIMHCDDVSDYLKKIKATKKSSKKKINKWKEYEKKIIRILSYDFKYKAYLAQLKDFAESAELAKDQISAIYKYIEKMAVQVDLSGIKLNDKTNIIFQVEIPGKPHIKFWEDGNLFTAWYKYYMRLKGSPGGNQITDTVSLDYVTGQQQPLTKSHPKKISNASGNAKLISGNDNTNYTFRGKFSDSFEAVSIGYETSQKAHQFLRYLIEDRGFSCGEQVILSYTIGSPEKLLPPPIDENSIFALLNGSLTKRENDIQIELRAETGSDYADALRKALSGFGHGECLKQHVKTAVIALDAATTGRLSITFYRELDRGEYLERVADWHDSCKWHQTFRDNENEKYVPYIGAPSVDRIIVAAHGKPRGREDANYLKIKKQSRERLLRCIFDGASLPRDYVVAAIRRASNPLAITKNDKFDRKGFEQIVSTTCALVRKDFQQREREEYPLSIELDRKDRDYLYGRLLGAADKLEQNALEKGDKSRTTAAIRYMQSFSQRPFRTWQTIHGCLNPYIQSKESDKNFFAYNEIQDIMQQFEPGDYEKDSPLNGSYLMGYYHERAHIEDLVKRAAQNKKKETNNGQQQ